MATHSGTLAWKIPWMEEPGRRQPMGSLRVGHDWATSLSLSCIGEGSGNPLQCSCLENPRNGGAWWAAIYGVAQSLTRLMRLSRSSSNSRIILAVGLSYMAFIMLRYVLSVPAFWRVFIINGCWILSKAFSASIEIIIWFLFFNLLMWCITLIDLQILKESLHPWDKALMVMMYDLFNVLLDSVC